MTCDNVRSHIINQKKSHFKICILYASIYWFKKTGQQGNYYFKEEVSVVVSTVEEEKTFSVCGIQLAAVSVFGM